MATFRSSCFVSQLQYETEIPNKLMPFVFEGSGVTVSVQAAYGRKCQLVHDGKVYTYPLFVDESWRLWDGEKWQPDPRRLLEGRLPLNECTHFEVGIYETGSSTRWLQPKVKS